ncbi:MAG: class I SAM-dependent methyltransferase [Chloroflexi bacterium]|nr:class I SAM-dependent methyltransferase [Chloroflexota bacterium]
MDDSRGHTDSSPFDSLATAYDAWFEEVGKLIFATEVKALQDVLPLLPKPWLEVGVGSGRFAQALDIETGIDPSVKLLEMAQRRGITVFQARGEERFFNEETFGTVFLVVTLCFVDSPMAVLQEACRILKPEGKIVLGLVLRESPWGKFYQLKKMEGHRFYKHATFYSYQEVERLLMDSGFTIEKVVSTLFQKPGEVKEMEAPREGFLANAGFTVIMAKKRPYSEER